MEVAAFLSSNDRAASVTVIGNTSVPFEYSLGHAVGQRIQEMFEEKGVKFIAKSGVVGFNEDDGKASGVSKVVSSDTRHNTQFIRNITSVIFKHWMFDASGKLNHCNFMTTVYEK